MLRIPRNIHSRSYTYARFHRQDKGRIAAIEKAVIPKVAQAAVRRGDRAPSRTALPQRFAGNPVAVSV
jgi:hypothetical protein